MVTCGVLRCVILRRHECDAEGSHTDECLSLAPASTGETSVSKSQFARGELYHVFPRGKTYHIFFRKYITCATRTYHCASGTTPAAVCDILPLRLLHEMGIDERDFRISPAPRVRTSVIRSTFYSVAVALDYLQQGRGDPCGLPKTNA